MSLKIRARLGTAAHFCEVVVLKLQELLDVFDTDINGSIDAEGLS